MKYKLLRLTFLVLSFIIWIDARAQTQNVQQGVVFKQGTNIRVSNADIQNKKRGFRTRTNEFGMFGIPASEGDTIVISCQGYSSRQIVVQSFKAEIIYIPATLELATVTITAQTLRQRLKETEHAFRSKGIYYKGKPPLYLLSPFGGSPITFFYELLSKNGKRARRFHRYADGELAYVEVASRFNDQTIKKIVPITDTDLPNFKTAYWPKPEQIRQWNEFDLLFYIKTSYQEFRKLK